MKRFGLILIAFVVFPFMAFAQNTIEGTITEAETGETLAGANVYLVGTNKGASTNTNGEYTIDEVADGDYTIRVSMVGFETIRQEISVSGDLELDFQLTTTSQSLDELKVFASRSGQKTPVAYSDIDQEQISNQLGSRDLPLVLNTTPSVYATSQGSGSGDARINVRGFSQRNVAVMINGVPVNDMENGWVYWSNWDGVADATSSIQVQRGMSNVNLAVPSVGGTMNILTSPSKNSAGGSFKQEIGNAGFKKTTLSLNTGMINDRFAISASGVRKEGNGMVEGTWTDSWAYYLGATLKINDSNSLDLYALGAPQRHGQRLYAQNIGTFDHSYARSLDSYDPAALNTFQERGMFFNQNVAGVSDSYDGKQYVGDGWIGTSIRNRYNSGEISERENFFHKPQINLNWYSDLTDKIKLTNVLYYSGGEGGGSGTLGEVVRQDANGVDGTQQPFFFGPSPWTWDWNATVAINSSPAGTWQNDFDSGTRQDFESIGILRNSRNNQWTVGDIVKVHADLGNFQLQGGLDWRTAEIEHYREVRDLLGGQFFIDNGDDFNPNKRVGLGDKVDYNFTNNVNWFGGYLQGEYATDRYSLYTTVGLTNIKYKHENFFVEDPNNAGQRLVRESPNIQGWQTKFGGLYTINQNFDVYGNFGIISKVPIFDNVIDDRSGAVNDDPTNEKYYFYEGGVRFSNNQGNLAVKANFYLTQRKDRSFTTSVIQQDGTEGLLNVSGVDQMHRGLELESSYRPFDFLRIDLNMAHNLWKYTDDVSARYLADFTQNQYQELNLSINDLRVGNAPQTQYAYTVTVTPTPNAMVQIVGKTFMRHYSDFNPFDRTFDPNNPSTADRAFPWQAPSYTVFDLNASYNLDNMFKGVKLFVNVFNLLDETYIQDSVDNSDFNSFDNDHDADDAEVFFGLPRRFNAGFTVTF
ncbi:MAG: TonB-dependent receptor [Balneolaceae bacterium]|nr:TonB-dependent receptor [Balneolaceae bacterium]